jgi:broad specificity phosphatase PhoE
VTGVVELVFETHALTTDNERGIATGWLGGSLSARGRGLAAELGTRRRNDRIDEVLCSDLARAVETSEIAFGGTPLRVTLDWRRGWEYTVRPAAASVAG